MPALGGVQAHGVSRAHDLEAFNPHLDALPAEVGLAATDGVGAAAAAQMRQKARLAHPALTNATFFALIMLLRRVVRCK